MTMGIMAVVIVVVVLVVMVVLQLFLPDVTPMIAMISCADALVPSPWRERVLCADVESRIAAMSTPTSARPSALRMLFTIRSAPGRFPFALRAGFCMALPVAAGVASGDVAAGLMATIGAFTSLYGSGRPYLYRAVMLALIAAGFAIAVGLGLIASASHVSAVLVVTVLAMAATLLCRALNTGPPGAYLFALACAAGTSMPAGHITTVHASLLVLAGGALSWVVHMGGALFAPRRPERAAVLRAAQAVQAFIAAVATPRQDAARHAAALALHEAWSALVTYQPLQRDPGDEVGRLRGINRELHLLYADAMSHAMRREPMPPSAIEEVRRIAAAAREPRAVAPARHDEIPLGRLRTWEAVKEALKPGSMSLLVVLRVGVASLIAGALGAAIALDRAYWCIAAAVLMLHFGFDWRTTVQRGFERLAGTWAGLILAGALLAWHPGGVWLVIAVGVLQFTIEMLVVRNYALAVVFITAIALLIASGGHPVADARELLLARGIDTAIGCFIGIAVYAVLKPRAAVDRVRAELAATLEEVVPTLRLLCQGEVTTRAAREQRRRLQHRVFALGEAFDGGVGGMRRERRETEQLWPAVAAAQRLAYRVLAECWAFERGQALGERPAPLTGEVCQALDPVLANLAADVRGHRKPSPLPALPELLGEEIRQLHAALSREPT